MSRLEELKKQNPKLNFNVIDLINSVIPKPKYTEFIINLVKRKLETYHDRKEIIRTLESHFDIYVDDDKFSNLELIIFFKIFDTIGESNLKSIKKFIELNERNLIKNTNLSTYKNFDEIRLEISLAELNLIDKDIEKQVLKLYESPEWLVLRPLSWNSSRKYGANTKWCTASEQEPDYFYKYGKRGVLIYAIDKITGNKVAGYLQINDYDDRELSFWNILDKRIDSMEANLPHHIMDIFRKEFNNPDKVSNWELLSKEEQKKQENWLEINGYYTEKVMREPIPMPVENNAYHNGYYEGGETPEEILQINEELNQEYDRILAEEPEPEPTPVARIIRLINGRRD